MIKNENCLFGVWLGTDVMYKKKVIVCKGIFWMKKVKLNIIEKKIE